MRPQLSSTCHNTTQVSHAFNTSSHHRVLPVQDPRDQGDVDNVDAHESILPSPTEPYDEDAVSFQPQKTT